MYKKIPCTVEVLTYNSENMLSRALDSIKDFAEIIVIDGGSTDGTLDIARKYGCVILKQDIAYKNEDGTLRDFGGVRNQGLDVASYRWFFFLDSDEYLDDEILSEVRDVIVQDKQGAYFVPRKYVYDNVVIDCATTYPSYQMRFFHRSRVKRFIKKVHERIELEQGISPAYLRQSMYVPLLLDVKELREKQKRYLRIENNRMRGIPASNLFRKATRELSIGVFYIWRIFRTYIICRGTKLPLAFEWMRIWYQSCLVRMLLVNFFKKIFIRD